MNHKKSRVMDFFRRIDKDQDGKITRQEFIDGILASSESSHKSKHSQTWIPNIYFVGAGNIMAKQSSWS